jgi:hypothetical protein
MVLRCPSRIPAKAPTSSGDACAFWVAATANESRRRGARQGDVSPKEPLDGCFGEGEGVVRTDTISACQHVRLTHPASP